MPYCVRCGVEVDGGVEKCPLCNTPIQRLEDIEPGERRYPEQECETAPRLSVRSSRRILWEVLTLLYAIAAIVVIGSDLRLDATISWSLYPAASLVLAWIYTSLFFFVRRRPVAAIGGTIVSSVAYLLVIDLINGKLDWFFPLGLPICALFVIICGGVTLAILKSKTRGFNVVAFALIGSALFCVGVDLLISLHWLGKVHLTWSIVVLLTVVPVTLIFLFLHYRLRNRVDFKRLFYM